jgi:hypothetical protein
MRAVGPAIWVLVVGCSFQSPAVDPPGKDAAGDPDGPRTDAPPTDGPPIDTPPIDAPQSTARRKLITIDPDRVTGLQAAFPVWIALTDNDLKARATMSGADIHFTLPGGTDLPYQLQRWTPSMGRLEAWVRVTLDDNAPTLLELRYGDAATAHAPNPPMVFSSSFLAVWHLDDPLNNATIAEATNQRLGTAQGGLGPNDQVTAQLGGGVDFDGNDDRIAFTNPFSGGGDHTISAWVNQRTANGIDSIVTVGNPMGGQARWFHAFFAGGLNAGFYGPDWNTAAAPLPDIQDDNWVLVHWVFKGSNRQSRIYLNGVQAASHTFGQGTINTQGTGGHLGWTPDPFGPGGNTPGALNGILDEVRLSTAERNAGWIATEYANQSAPQTFYTVGPEQTLP